MLQYLRIRRLAIMEDVEIRFADGLNLLTGETGAGKSIVVDALGLAVGQRADAELIRTGEDGAVVEAVFSVAGRADLTQALRSFGLDPDPEEDSVIIRRELGRGGSRAFLNGSPTTAGMLRRLAPWLVQVHGQHQHQALLREENHRLLLDAFADADSLLHKVATEHQALAGLLARLEDVSTRRAQTAERVDLLRLRQAEIEAVDPQAGEDDELRGRRGVLHHAGEIGTLVEQSRLLLEESEEGSILTQVAQLEENLRQLAAYDPDMGASLEETSAARSALLDLAAGLRSRPMETEFDAGELDRVQQRLSALAGLARKHGGSLASVLAARDQARAELQALQADLEDPELLQQEVQESAGRLAVAADKLSKLRRGKARALQGAVEKELQELAMAGTRFQVELSREEQSGSPVQLGGKAIRCDAHGVDTVRFLMSANPGEDLRPLARIASGGELSRLMLALEGALRQGAGREAAAGCLVFDEVDAGIGGRVAAVVGGKLQRLSQERQVLCVTHLPQIASRADAHFHIEKKVERGRTRTSVRPLDRDARLAEVARMLGGARVTRATREHAAELIGKRGS
jgi:DNA repair protein RecN (Recombination protein N)